MTDKDDIKVALLQTDIKWENEAANIAEATHLIKQNPACDLYVLPEMWATGFVVDPRDVAPDEEECVALQWMKRTASQQHCAICGSLAVRIADGTFRNRHYFVDGRARKTYFYDKHHLFTHGGEAKLYTPGSERTVIQYQGFRIRLLTCYDLRFPCWIRYTDEQPYDIIIIVANWPQSRQPAWNILTAARAIENQCYLVGVNRTGDDVFTHYSGGSRMIDPVGHVLTMCEAHEQVKIAQLSVSELLHRRDKFRVLEDRD